MENRSLHSFRDLLTVPGAVATGRPVATAPGTVPAAISILKSQTQNSPGRKKMTTEIGFGVAGCGMIGKVQAEAIASIPGARLLAVYARDERRVSEFAAKFGAA